MDTSLSQPLVSIVTPAYNEEAFLKANLRSVKEQSYPNVEHVVVDDGSTDGTPDILHECDDQYNLRWVSQENQGLAAAVNRGFELAQGEFVIWLNADDVLFTDRSVTRVVEAFQSNEEADLLCAPFVKLDVDGRIQDIKVPYRSFSRKRLLRRCYGAFIFMRSEVTDAHRLDASYQHTPDYEFYLRLADQGCEFGYVDEILFGHRRHAETKTESASGEMGQESARCRREHGARMGWRYEVLRTADLAALRALKLWGIYLLIRVNRSDSNLVFEHPDESMSRYVSRIVHSVIPV